jgi:hypothetical protein
MTENRWRAAFAVAAAMCSFLLVQPEVTAIPVLAIVLGCVNVGLAAIKAPADA